MDYKKCKPTVRAIKVEIARLEKRLGRLKEIIDARPLSRIVQLRSEANQIIEKYDGDYKAIAKLIEPLAKEEKRMLALAEKQKNLSKLIDQEVDLEFEINELKNSIFWEERRN